MNPQLLQKLVNDNPSIYTLFRLYCSEHPTDTDIANWFSEIDFEALPPEFAGMAAGMSAANHFSGTPQQLIPRLQGIIKYIHTLNLGMLAGLCFLGKQYNQSGISMLLMGATAIRLKHPDHPQQHLWQTELGILAADYPRAIALAADAGFTIQENAFSAIAKKGSTQCIILYKLSPNAYLYHDIKPIITGGVSFSMPCDATLFVSLAEAAFRSLNHPTPGKPFITRLVHLHHIISSGIQWKLAATTAAQHATANQVRLILEIYNQFVPETISPDILEYFGSKTQVQRLTNNVLTCRSLPPNRHKLRRLWLFTKIQQADKPYTTLPRFLYKLIQKTFMRLFRKLSI